jgi:PIN domain nuclease of toxin-antitoxin system
VKYLLDTCILLWSLDGDKKRLQDFWPILQDPRNYIAVSVVSYWEIAIKKQLGKLTTPDNLIEVVENTGFKWINLEVKHIEQLETLPSLHNDPFDRLLIAQAQAERFTLLSGDRVVLQYFSH